MRVTETVHDLGSDLGAQRAGNDVAVLVVVLECAVERLHEAIDRPAELLGLYKDVDRRLVLAFDGVIDVFVLVHARSVEHLECWRLIALRRAGRDVLSQGRRNQEHASERDEATQPIHDDTSQELS